MDWQTIRVLTNNLGELLDQYKRGEHLKAEVDCRPGDSRVKTEWWLGIRSLTVLLAQALHVGDDLENLHVDTRTFWESTRLEDNVYTRHAVALVALGRNLLVGDTHAKTTPRMTGGEIAVLSACEVSAKWDGMLRISLSGKSSSLADIEVRVERSDCARVELGDPVQMVIRVL